LKDPYLKDWLQQGSRNEDFSYCKFCQILKILPDALEMQTSECYCDIKIQTDAKVN